MRRRVGAEKYSRPGQTRNGSGMRRDTEAEKYSRAQALLAASVDLCKYYLYSFNSNTPKDYIDVFSMLVRTCSADFNQRDSAGHNCRILRYGAADIQIAALHAHNVINRVGTGFIVARLGLSTNALCRQEWNPLLRLRRTDYNHASTETWRLRVRTVVSPLSLLEQGSRWRCWSSLSPDNLVQTNRWRWLMLWRQFSRRSCCCRAFLEFGSILRE